MRKKRITFTINPETVKKLDNLVDGVTVTSRSHAVENILNTYFGSSIDTAVILAGGQKIKKTPLFKLNDINLLQYQVLQLKKAGIKNIILNTNDDLNYFDSFVEEFGLKNINLIVEKEIKTLGTGGAIKNLYKYLTDRPFLVIHGDIYSDLDINDFIEYHLSERYTSTIALTTVSDPQKYGLVKVKGSEIIAFLEKPKIKKSSNLVSAGVYIINPEVLKGIKPNTFVSMEKDIFPKLANENKLASYIHSGMWCDIAYSDMYKEAIRHFKDKRN